MWQVIARYDLSARYLLTWNSCSPFPTLHLMSVRSMLSLMSITSLSVLVVSVSLVSLCCCTGPVPGWKIRLLMSLLHQSRDFITILEFWGDMSAKNFLHFLTKLFQDGWVYHDAVQKLLNEQKWQVQGKRENLIKTKYYSN